MSSKPLLPHETNGSFSVCLQEAAALISLWRFLQQSQCRRQMQRDHTQHCTALLLASF
jgi:hypothetical protein